MTIIRKIIREGFASLGFQIERLPSGPSDPIHLWDDHHELNKLMQYIYGHTVCDKLKCFMIYQFARQASSTQGAIAEVGVYKGGTAWLLSRIFKDTQKTLHLFDTFSGMPSTNVDKDIHQKGDFSDTSLESVKAYLNDCNDVFFYQGIFPETAGPIQHMKFCFVHIDVDIYKSTMDCCNFFYPKIENGGIMIFDDYGTLDCPGVKKAVDEYFTDKSEIPCYLPTGQCVIIRK